MARASLITHNNVATAHSFLIAYTLNLTYILRFFWFIACLLPCTTKSAERSNVNIITLSATKNMTWYPYPRSIQLRSGFIIVKSSKNLIGMIPTTIDVDILYIHSFFASQLESYPRIGLSFLIPYTLQKEQKLRFPNIWGILAYIELYQSHPAVSTWGNRINIGAMHGSLLAQAHHQPNYSLVTIQEITYHWLCTPSWQINFGIGLLINWWATSNQDKTSINQSNISDHLNANKQLLYKIDNEDDTIKLKFSPTTTVSIRYTTHTKSLLIPSNSIHYRKRKNSRVDCSIAGNSRWLALDKKYYFILRGTSLLSLALNSHSSVLCAMELGYNWYKKASLASVLSEEGVEITPFIGYEICYGYYLLQLQLGYEITESKQPTIQNYNKNYILSKLEKQCRFAINAQYRLTERFFLGISARSQEIPALRLGMSW